MGRRPSGTCTSSRWTRGRAGWARDGGSCRNRSGSSDLAERIGCSRPCRGTTIPRCACSNPSGSSGSPVGSYGGGTAGAGSPCRCGCSLLPTRASSRTLSPTSLPRRLKRSPRPRDGGGAPPPPAGSPTPTGGTTPPPRVLRLFNVDLRFSQRYAIEHDIFPMGLLHYANGVWRAEEEHFALDYPLPALRKSLLDLHVDNPAGIPRMQDRLLGARVDDVEIDGDVETILKGIDAGGRSKDPDVLMTDGGDAFLMPYLAAKASDLGVNLQLGRDPDRFAGVKAKSYFKYAENLLRGDRGGFTFEPEVGVHEGLYELDFSSLYPSIMVKYNISAETLDCSCCTTDGLPVPELRYHLCTRRVGIVGRVLKPLIER